MMIEPSVSLSTYYKENARSNRLHLKKLFTGTRATRPGYRNGKTRNCSTSADERTLFLSVDIEREPLMRGTRSYARSLLS